MENAKPATASSRREELNHENRQEKEETRDNLISRFSLKMRAIREETGDMNLSLMVRRSLTEMLGESAAHAVIYQIESESLNDLQLFAERITEMFGGFGSRIMLDKVLADIRTTAFPSDDDDHEDDSLSPSSSHIDQKTRALEVVARR